MINFGENWLIYKYEIMKHLRDIIQESILDIEDNLQQLDDLSLKHTFLNWWKALDYTKRHTNIEIKNGVINLDDSSIYVDENTKLLPSSIKFGHVRTFNITNNQQFFDKCKSQFPYATRQLSIGGIDVKDFQMEVLNADFWNDVKTIKNVTLTIPEQRPGGLTRNVFYINFLTTKRNIEGLKINGSNNIIVNSTDCEIGNFMVNQIKYEVSSYKRKNGHFKYQNDLDNFIMEVIYKHLPMDHIDKYWKGVRRIIFKDKSGGLRNGVGLGFANDSYLKPGDFMIEKMVGGMKHDQWVPIQKMFKGL